LQEHAGPVAVTSPADPWTGQSACGPIGRRIGLCVCPRARASLQGGPRWRRRCGR